MNAMPPRARALPIAVVTGGHHFDVPHFHELLGSLRGLEPIVQHLDDFTASPEPVRDSYAAVLFYCMPGAGPADEDQPWYAGKPRAALEHLGQTPQGIAVLHHALVAFPKWPAWGEMVGLPDRTMHYFPNETIRVEPTAVRHPITRGLAPWTMVDETYTLPDAGPGCEVLLTVDNPHSTRTVAWTRRHRRSRVFCFALGHDNTAWSDPNFRRVLRRGLLWSAGRP